MRIMVEILNQNDYINVRFRLNFYLGKNEIDHHRLNEHLKISNIAKFGSEMLQNIALQSLYIFVLRAENATTSAPNLPPMWQSFFHDTYTKLENFARLYISYFTALRHQILQFLPFSNAPPSCGRRFLSFCPDQN